MTKKLLNAIKSSCGSNIKKIFEECISVKLWNKLEQEKINLSKNIISEADVDIDYSEPSVSKDKSQLPQKPEQKAPVKISRVQVKPGYYNFLFPFNNKMMIVHFEPIDNSNTNYKAYVVAKGQETSRNPLGRLGIANVNLIPSLFVNVLRAIEQFTFIKKPASIRFYPGEGIQYPAIFHQYIFQALKDFSTAPGIKKSYTILRGDSIKDGSAFVLRRGASQSNLKSQSWRPSKVETSQKTEEIANVSGQAVATDRPTKAGLGFPGLAKETEKEKKKVYTAIERRKKNNDW